MPATAMLAALRRDLAGGAYRLVLWQTGTAEAVRKVPPEEFAHTLDAGAEAVRAAGADLLLVDPQYSRMLQTHADLPPYQRAMQEAAARHRAVLFHRFDLGRQWAESGAFDLETAAVPDRPQMAAELNACLGQALAAAVLRAALPAAAVRAAVSERRRSVELQDAFEVGKEQGAGASGVGTCRSGV